MEKHRHVHWRLKDQETETKINAKHNVSNGNDRLSRYKDETNKRINIKTRLRKRYLVQIALVRDPMGFRKTCSKYQVVKTL
jgi:hypothetical protein